MKSYCERIKIEKEGKGINTIHLSRYWYARDFCRDKKVLDCACGTGYGATALHNTVKEMVGVDLDFEAIQYAKEHYHFPNVSFFVMDATHLSIADGYFDVICSFETIEHLKKPGEYLLELTRVLHPNGFCFISTPNSKVTTSTPSNPHHFQEWNRSDFEVYLRRFFSSVELYGVNRKQTLVHRLIQRMDPLHLRGLFPRNWRSKVGRQIGTTAFHEMEFVKDIEVGPHCSKSLSTLAFCQGPKKDDNGMG